MNSDSEQLPEIKNFPDFDTYLKLLGFEFIKKASMCYGKKTTLIYKKPGMTCQLIIDTGSLLEGLNLEADYLKEGIS